MHYVGFVEENYCYKDKVDNCRLFDLDTVNLLFLLLIVNLFSVHCTTITDNRFLVKLLFLRQKKDLEQEVSNGKHFGEPMQESRVPAAEVTCSVSSLLAIAAAKTEKVTVPPDFATKKDSVGFVFDSIKVAVVCGER